MTDSPHRQQSKEILGVVGLVIAVVVAILGVYSYHYHEAQPNTVFRQALGVAFSTKQVEQTQTIGSLTTDYKFDVANITKARVSFSTALQIPGSSGQVGIQSYSNAQNSYAELTAQPGMSRGQLASVTDQWISLRTNGTTATNYACYEDQAGCADYLFLNKSPPPDAYAAALPDARTYLFGQFIFGNFTKSEQKQLIKYISDNSIYQYNAKQVTTGTVAGHPVYIFPVTINTNKLIELNAKAAAMFGVSDLDFQNSSLSNNLIAVRQAKLYIARDTKQLLRADAILSATFGSSITSFYSNYNHVTLPAEPKAALSYQAASPNLDNTCQNLSATNEQTNNTDTGICALLALLRPSL